ncbi:MAG TPA: hypothetical protein VF306_02455 [Pirellulales bacterium]
MKCTEEFRSAACRLGNLRRTHRDFAGVVELIVVELIAVHELDGSFARFL